MKKILKSCRRVRRGGRRSCLVTLFLLCTSFSPLALTADDFVECTDPFPDDFLDVLGLFEIPVNDFVIPFLYRNPDTRSHPWLSPLKGVIMSKRVGNLTPKRTVGGLDALRNQAEPTENSTPGVIPCASWRVIEVHTLPGYRLRVKFIDGTTGEVDLSGLVTSDKAGVFAALGDPALFSKAYVEYGAVMWPGGIDLAPDAMYDEIKKEGRWVLE